MSIRAAIHRVNLAALSLCLLVSLCGCGGETGKSSKATFFAMDTVMSVTVYGENCKDVLKQCSDEINRLDKLFSPSNSASEIFLLNSRGSVELSDDTMRILTRAKELYGQTGGAFDITVGRYVAEWGFDTKKYTVPSAERLAEVSAFVGCDKLDIDGGAAVIEKGVKADLGGIAKGYAAERIDGILSSNGVESALVSLGGNVLVRGRAPDGGLWTVGIADPFDPDGIIGWLNVTDVSVVTSGGYIRNFQKDGVTYHHIIDPATGYPAESGLASVTVVSRDHTAADALSTALFVIGKDAALAFQQTSDIDFELVLIDTDGNITVTDGLKSCFTADR